MKHNSCRFCGSKITFVGFFKPGAFAQTAGFCTTSCMEAYYKALEILLEPARVSPPPSVRSSGDGSSQQVA